MASNSIVTEIQLHKDGSWSTHVNKSEATILDTPAKPPNKVEIICDDLGKYFFIRIHIQHERSNQFCLVTKLLI